MISNILSPSIFSVFPIFPWLPQRSNPVRLCFSCSHYLAFILGTQAIALAISICMHVVGECVLNHYSCVRLFVALCMDCSPPGSSVHGILQARTLKWIAMPSSRRIFWTQLGLLHLLHWQMGSLPLVPPGKSPYLHTSCKWQ